MSWDFFISFSNNDKERVSQIVDIMEGYGASCWFQLKDSKLDYLDAIVEGIENSSAFVVFVSPNSAKSKAVKNEIKCALDNGKKVLPVVISGEITDSTYKAIRILIGTLNCLNVKDEDCDTDDKLVDKIFYQLDYEVFYGGEKEDPKITADETESQDNYDKAQDEEQDTLTCSDVDNDEETIVDYEVQNKVNYPNDETFDEQEEIEEDNALYDEPQNNRKKPKTTRPNAQVLKVSGDYIGYKEFEDNKSLTDVIIPKRVTSISGMAFNNCSRLTSIVIPNSVKSIDKGVFCGCSSIRTITLPFVGEKIEKEYSYDSTEFKHIFKSSYSSTVPKSLKEVIITGGKMIDDNAFKNCSNLTSITLPDTITSIGNRAFSECHSLTDINIPDDVTYIGDYAFANCSSLTSIIIPNSVNHIGKGAFLGCERLISITLPEDVTTIDNNTFQDCIRLKKIVIFDSVESIGDNAFSGCSNLVEITIPTWLTNIGDRAFSDCTKLKKITIPSSVTQIGQSVFQGCAGLTNITVDIDNNTYHSNENCIIETHKRTLIVGCKNSIIPNSVTSIYNGAFSGCTGLTSVTIGSGVTSIGENAFAGCSNLTDITIPNSVTSIGSNAFSGCTGLTSVTIGSGVTSIGENAFAGCSNLTDITIPQYLTTLGKSVFDSCTNLKKIYCRNFFRSLKWRFSLKRGNHAKVVFKSNKQ